MHPYAMTRRSSVRAQAREIYRDLAAAQATTDKSATPTPDPSPSSILPKSDKSDFGGGGETSLTTQVRALYEDSAVPVREIAGVAGVTERTIYKYVAKHGWKRRYRCAPEKGAGGRFIRREDKDKPFATGLKATDPAGAARAVAACQHAESLSREAQAQVEEAQRFERHLRAIVATNSALQELREYREARQKKGLPARPDDRIERVLTLMVNMALTRWEALLAQEEERAAGK
jgi:hypothetical protein